LRTLQGFVSAPINLAFQPRPGDLEMSMFHIADLMAAGHGISGPAGSECVDCADVQIQLDGDPDSSVDDWKTWDNLVPFQNAYDYVAGAWSQFSPGYYCRFTPGDTGSGPPAPRGVHETMCFPQGAWAFCGSVFGTSAATTNRCPGPGSLDPSGVGVWVESKFKLADYAGHRVRIRWIASTWEFDAYSSSYQPCDVEWSGCSDADDGWWLDNIKITGAIERQMSTAPDLDQPPATACPAGCDPSVGDRGTQPVLSVLDAAGNPIDGVTRVAIAGETIKVSAALSTLPGGCAGGAPQYRFLRNGTLVQDWSSKTYFLDSPMATSTYRLLVRCGTDFACTGQTGASVDVPVYSGDGGDAILGRKTGPGVIDTTAGVAYDGAGRTTIVSWFAPLPTADLYRGTIGGGLSPGRLTVGEERTWRLVTTGCLVQNAPGQAAPGGGYNGTTVPLGQGIDPDPATGLASIYLVSSQTTSSLSVNALGCAVPGLCSVGACQFGGGACVASGGSCGECLRVACSSAMQSAGGQPLCPSGGICLDVDAPATGECLAGSDPRKVVREVEAVAVCP
ncbi:MAG TPA: hypothetical protein VN898_01680, partial [Candidatus Binatia bacterium]|nr:hypothetical protein [Candidatus Binatia bacterium]